MDMHVIDDDTMQDLIRFVEAHHTWVRHIVVARQSELHLQVMLQQLLDIIDNYKGIIDQARALDETQSSKKAPTASKSRGGRSHG
jgi:hypothetical protein